MNIDKKKLTPIVLVSIFLVMLGLSFAAVPFMIYFVELQGLVGQLKMLHIKKYQKLLLIKIIR